MKDQEILEIMAIQDNLRNKLQDMMEKIESEGRSKSPEEQRKADRLLKELDEVTAKLPSQYHGPTRPDVSTTTRRGGLSANRTIAPYELRGPTDPKDHDSLFGAKPGSYHTWQDKRSGYFQALFSGRMHPGLKRAMSEGIASDGGFLVPTEYSRTILNVALENQIVAPLAWIYPMRSNEVKVPGFAIGDHSSNLMGGFTASYKEETGTISEASPKTRNITLNAKKLTGLVRFSNELLADAPNGEATIMNLCGSGLGWYRDKMFLKGTGAGQPQGVLNANCLITVDKESSQTDNTIVYENLTSMLSRLWPGSFANSVWVCHQTTIPQLLGLGVAVGTGGSHVPVLKESNGEFTMLTRPVIFTEKTETLGTKGDIMLCDFSQYIIGLRDGLRMDVSPHVYFTSDESVGRLIERHDGQPTWGSVLTLEDGETTVSPFVTLEAR